ncbi:MAG: hypothetical protein MJE77_29665 [Proteobacteria bacterium]|nr:hypothetical protein [Pseudomonadota bacterium]
MIGILGHEYCQRDGNQQEKLQTFTDKFHVSRDQVRLTPPSPSVTWEIGFREKETPRFRKFLERLHNSNASDVYLWTPATNICGLLPPLPLREVNFDFPFNLNPEGILTVLTSDLQDSLILDYSETEEGARLEIEAAGPHWSTVEF